MRNPRLVAVLGAGTMGSRIAAHFANAGVPALLLDLASPGPDRNAGVKRAIKTAAKSRPGAFFSPYAKDLVTPGNFEDDFGTIAACDWIVEAVVEDLEVKRSVWKRAAALSRDDAILSTNTSGIPLARIIEGFPDEVRRRFLGTHFFNPPRYLHLVELIPGLDTAPEVLEYVSDFCDRRLGKGVVQAKDTPNFIANRIGSFFGATAYRIMIEDGYTVEEVDALTGPLIGLPKSATFRLLDLIGLDVWASVSKNLYDLVPDDPWRDRFLPPEFLVRMLERGWLGEKSGQGFYRRVGAAKEIHAIDWKTLEYHPARKPEIPSVDAARSITELPERLRMLATLPDRWGRFLWKLFSDTFLYAAERIPEISPRVVEIDRAMKWGYAHKLGPFELWDALGFESVCDRLEREGRMLPLNVAGMRAAGAASFYRAADRGNQPRAEYFDLRTEAYAPLESLPGGIDLAAIRRARGVVKSSAGASLIDLDDGVLCLEFHSKANTIGDDEIAMVESGIEEAARNFQALLIANQGANFSGGANLLALLAAARERNWDAIEAMVRRFQQMNADLKRSPVAVVAAPFSRVLGGGAELVLHAARIQASAELYMGMIEASVGLIPAGGGCKELLQRLDASEVFELIAFAKVSTSAAIALELGFLRESDGITMNPDRLIGDAKAAALALAPNYAPPAASGVQVGGEQVYAALKLSAWTTYQGGFITSYDLEIAEKLAYVLSGGRLSGTQVVPEQYVLDLEREAFLSLCGNTETQARMERALRK